MKINYREIKFLEQVLGNGFAQLKLIEKLHFHRCRVDVMVCGLEKLVFKAVIFPFLCGAPLFVLNCFSCYSPKEDQVNRYSTVTQSDCNYDKQTRLQPAL